MATNWSESGHKLIGKWPQIDRKVATKWPSTYQFVKRPPSYLKEVIEWLPIDPKLIPKWSKCGHQRAINVVWKQQAIPKWFQSLKWSTSTYKKVAKRPSWNLKVVPKWSPSSQQMIQKWSPSNHQMVHRLSQSDHEMVTKWPNFKQFFDALQQILVANSYIYAYHCNVCRNWQLIQWGTILREWKRFDRVQNSINTWNERPLWAYYTFKCGLRLWHFDILFVYLFSCLFVYRCKRNMVQSFWRTITFCIFVKTIHFQHQQGSQFPKIFLMLRPVYM